MSRHCAYSDDSGSDNKRYQALSVVSGKVSVLVRMKDELKGILSSNGVKEIKFEHVSGHGPNMGCANKFIELAVSMARAGSIRIDTITWDLWDSRHHVQRRDDSANMERMYYRVLRHMGECWKQVNWDFFPDEQSGVNWESVRSYLNSTRMNRVEPGILRLFKEKPINFAFASVSPSKSGQEALIQLADVFAGVARFSREKGTAYLLWVCSEEAKKYPGLFEIPQNEIPTGSNRDVARFTLLRRLDQLCKGAKLCVSIKTRGYLCTHKPSKPINFWNYEPQTDLDRAPTSSSASAVSFVSSYRRDN
jgi:hypothetical protein